MKKKVALILLVICVSFTLSGCWSSEEPKNLAIINSIIYDCDEEGNYLVTAQIINTSSISSSGMGTTTDKNPSLIIKGKGASVAAAVDNMTARLEKNLFAAHNKVRFLSQRLVSDEYCFTKFLDFIFRDSIADETSLLVVVKNEDLDKIYKSAIGLATLTGNFVDTLHQKKQEHSSSSVFYRTFEFVREYYEDGIDPVMGQVYFHPLEGTPTLNPGGDMKEAKYELTSEGMAVFKDLRFVDFMDASDTEIYNVVFNNAKIVKFDMFLDSDTVSMVLVKPSADIKVSKKDDQVYVDIKVTGKIIVSNFFIYDINDENSDARLKEVEAKASEHLAKRSVESIKRGLALGCDIYGFGQKFHASNPKVWREISKDWENYYKNAIVNVEYKLNLSREGEINRPFAKED
ncbi:MAG: Ger(x)C family spore germination protein [Clostridiales bacterium]|nr:Ger(x)C family spore germination protein [Clostridiales bacterium]